MPGATRISTCAASMTRLLLSSEHRAAPSQTGLPLGLRGVGDALALEILDAIPTPPQPTPSPIDKLAAILVQRDGPLTLAELRQAAACARPLSVRRSPCSPRKAACKKPLAGISSAR